VTVDSAPDGNASSLARLADIAYRRCGRMVLAWIAAVTVIIGVGSSLAGSTTPD
jgi:hypothetical protein